MAKARRQPNILRNKRLRLRVVQAAKKYFWYGPGDELMVDAVLATIATRKWRTYPCWLLIMAPPGSGKTDLIDRIEHPNVISISQVTPKSLASGWRGAGGKDPSLLNIANRKVIIIKDFTSILTSPRESRDAIIGILRDAYDGSHSAVFGNIGLVSYKTHFTVIAAVTPIYEHFYSVTQQLGERFLIFRLRAIDPVMVASTSLDNMFKDAARLAELEAALHSYIAKLRMPPLTSLRMPSSQRKRMVDLATLVAGCRTHVHRSGTRKTITTDPQRETAGRLVRQLTQIAFGRAVSCGRLQLNNKDMALAVRIASDCIPTVVSKVIQSLFRINDRHAKRYPTDPAMWYCSPADVQRATHLGVATVKQRLGDLEALGLVKTQGHPRSSYCLRKDYIRAMRELRMWNGQERG
jgi:hypothetical protein